MKIVIAPDSFKESLSAIEVANTIGAGFRLVFPEAEIVQLPIADGGEGTVEAMIASTGGQRVEFQATGPLGTPVPAFYGITGDGCTAIIEMAAASGLMLVPRHKRNPLAATSFGTGELIRHALDREIRSFIIGIGGSGTNDAGAGMLQALGVGLFDASGQPLGFGGGELNRLAQIDISTLDPRVAVSKFQVACDVTNPLTGPNGASAVFGPQKGADVQMVTVLEENLQHFAAIVKRDLGKDIATLPGGGAAGGLGAALYGFLGGQLDSGVDIVLKAVGLKEHLRGADLVITGEGRIDGQSFHGKAPVGVARTAKRMGIPVIAVAGTIGDGGEKAFEHSIDALFSTSPGPQTLDEALNQAGDNLFFWARNTASVIRLFREGKS